MSDAAEKTDTNPPKEEEKQVQPDAPASDNNETTKPQASEEAKVSGDKTDKPKDKKHIKKDNSDTAENEIRVAASGQIKKYLGYAFRILDKTDHKYLTVRATGNAIVKALILIELVKRRKGDLHQLNQIYSIEIVTIENSNQEGIGSFENRRRVTAMDTILSREILTKADIVTKDGTKHPLEDYEFDQHPGYQKPEPAEPKGEVSKRDNKEKKEHKKHGKGPKRYNVRDDDDDKQTEAKGGKKQRQENDKKNKDKGAPTIGRKDDDQKDDKKKKKKSRKDNLKESTPHDDEFDDTRRGRGGRNRGGRRGLPGGGPREGRRYNQLLDQNAGPQQHDQRGPPRREDLRYGPPFRGYDDFYVGPRDRRGRGGRGGGPPMMGRGFYDEPGYYGPPMYDQHGRPNLRYRIEDRHPGYPPYDNRGPYGYDYYPNYGPPPGYRGGPGGRGPMRGGRDEPDHPRDMRGPPRDGPGDNDRPARRGRPERIYNPGLRGPDRSRSPRDRAGPNGPGEDMQFRGRGRGGRGRGERGRGGRGDDGDRPPFDGGDDFLPLPGHGRGRGERGRGRGDLAMRARGGDFGERGRGRGRPDGPPDEGADFRGRGRGRGDGERGRFGPPEGRGRGRGGLGPDGERGGHGEEPRGGRQPEEQGRHEIKRRTRGGNPEQQENND